MTEVRVITHPEYNAQEVTAFYFGAGQRSKLKTAMHFGISTWWVGHALVEAGHPEEVSPSWRDKIEASAKVKAANDGPNNLVARPHDLILNLKKTITEYGQILDYIESLEAKLKEKGAHNVRLQGLLTDIQLELTKDR